jgi:transcriptional regulator with XRE-family HTH domain
LVLLRRELGLSQREAAERAGIPFGQWQGLEDDSRQSRRIDVKVARIARAFQVDREWLMWGGALTGPDDIPPAPGTGVSAGKRGANASLTRLRRRGRKLPLSFPAIVAA